MVDAIAIVAIIAIGALAFLAFSAIQFLKQLKVITTRIETLTDIQSWSKILSFLPFLRKK